MELTCGARCPVGRDGEGRLYAARAVSRGRPGRRRRGRGGVLRAGLTTTVPEESTGRMWENGWHGVRKGESGGRRVGTGYHREEGEEFRRAMGGDFCEGGVTGRGLQERIVEWR